MGRRTAKNLITLIGMACVFALTGCVSDEEVGKGPLTVAIPVAAMYQEYLKQGDPHRFYVSENGQCAFYSHCRKPPCRGTTLEEKSLKRCSDTCGSPCKVLATGGRLVWQGDIQGLDQPETGFLRVSWGSSDRLGAGLVRLDPSGTTAQMEFSLQGTEETCRGTLERKTKSGGQWSVICNKGLKGSGLVTFYQNEKDDYLLFPILRLEGPVHPGKSRILGAGTDPWKRPIWFYLKGLDGWADVEAAEDAPRNEAATATIQPEDAFKDCDICPEMVRIPAGQFTMGSIDGHPAEFPPRMIQVDKPFAVGRYEVTFDEWDACVADEICKRLPDEGWDRGRQPAINVSWADARNFLTWVSPKTGENYRLLTEAEFEYVARAGSTTDYPWGDKIDPSYVDIYAEKTWEVGRYKANAFGLYDTNGNAWEWVADCYQAYDPSTSDTSAVAGRCDRQRWPERVVRGGFVKLVADSARSAYRGKRHAGEMRGSSSTGLRVARDLH